MNEDGGNSGQCFICIGLRKRECDSLSWAWRFGFLGERRLSDSFALRQLVCKRVMDRENTINSVRLCVFVTALQMFVSLKKDLVGLKFTVF